MRAVEHRRLSAARLGYRNSMSGGDDSSSSE
jgi:hypothetical protein